MKVAVLLICTLAIISGALSAPQMRSDDADDEEFVVKKAVPCDPALCIAPACRCSGTVLDSTIPIENTPQVRYLLLLWGWCKLNPRFISKHFQVFKKSIPMLQFPLSMLLVFDSSDL